MNAVETGKNTDEAPALCLLAGANSIFVGARLLTTPNPCPDRDASLLARLGMGPGAGPIRPARSP